MISRLSKVGLGLGSVLFAAIAVSVSSTARDSSLSVCTLTAEATRYDGRTVSVKASVESDGLHYLALVDDRCPTVGVALELPASVREDPAVKALLKATFPSVDGTDKKVSGEFVGLFRMNDDHPARILKLISIADLQIANASKPRNN